MRDAAAHPVLEDILKEFGKGLHDLCQPLTTLQCRLYLGSLDETPEALAETLRQSLDDCERVMERVHQIQGRLEALKSPKFEVTNRE